MPTHRSHTHVAAHPRIGLASLLALSLTTLCAGGPEPTCHPAPLFTGNVVIPSPRIIINESNAPRATITAVDDVTSDGVLDLVYYEPTTAKFVYLGGTSDWWRFDPPVWTTAPFAPDGGYKLRDMNGDGHLDLISAGSSGIRIARGTGHATFEPHVTWGPSESSTRIEIGDFNGDGFEDIVYRAAFLSLRILWGAGNLTFPTWSAIIPVSCGAGSISQTVAGDLDLDGDVDLLVILSQCQEKILRNNGSGVFTEEVFHSFAAGGEFRLSDLNGDQYLDVVCTYRSTFPNSVRVFLNDDTGHFPAMDTYEVSSTTLEINQAGALVTDLDGDSRPEIVVRRDNNCGNLGFGLDDHILVFQNNGDGTFDPAPSLYQDAPANNTVGLLFAADLNGDKRPELITKRAYTSTILLNDGQGHFPPPHGSPMGVDVQTIGCSGGSFNSLTLQDIAYGDMNGDGQFDIVAGCGSPSNHCQVMLQHDDGSFVNIVTVPLTNYPNALVVSDFDRDGDLDIAASTTTGDGSNPQNFITTVEVARGNGDGTFSAVVAYDVAGHYARHIAAADLNGDQWLDLVVATRFGANYPSTPQGPRGISVHMNNQDGTFAPAVAYDVNAEVNWIAIADVNGDSNLDLGITGSGAVPFVAIIPGNGDGTFGPLGAQYTYIALQHMGVTFADVNHDDLPDMLTTLYGFVTDVNSGGEIVALNNGDGTFQTVAHVGAWVNRGDSKPSLVDLNGDSHVDLITTSEDSRFSVYMGNGDGTFGEEVAYPGALHLRGRLHVADFDGDGDLDLGSAQGCLPAIDTIQWIGFSRLMNNMCQPQPPSCPADIDGNSSVNVDDLLAVINSWGPCGKSCAADVSPLGPPQGDGIVNVNDLLMIINNWGPCP